MFLATKHHVALSRTNCHMQDDTSSTHLRPSRLSSAAAAASSSPDEGGLSSTAEAARQLTKCRFKGCKLMFASDLNKHRCQMSHLPSARNTTTKVGCSSG